MVNAGKQSVSRSRNAWKTRGPSAAASETKKAARYYAKTTKQVSKNLKKGSVKVSFGTRFHVLCGEEFFQEGI